MALNLRREDLKDRGERAELLGKTQDRTASTTFDEFLQEERHERDHEHQEDTVDATLDPVEDRVEIVASSLVADEVACLIELADRQLAIESAEEHHCTEKGYSSARY